MKLLLAMTFSESFWNEVEKLIRYFDHLSTTQWGIISAAAVSFGFLLLRGNSIKR